MTAPAILGHSQRFYDLLDSKAKNTDTEGRVYEGKITQDFLELDIAWPYYTRCMRLMQTMGCVHQLQRGGRVNPSRWQLLVRPTAELYALIDPQESNVTAMHEKLHIFTASVDQKLRDMRKTIERQESRLTHLGNENTLLAARVTELETQLNPAAQALTTKAS